MAGKIPRPISSLLFTALLTLMPAADLDYVPTPEQVVSAIKKEWTQMTGPDGERRGTVAALDASLSNLG